tara:strand:- start:2223 stop:2681 length:459 start_codon:yes stop_codon:yes gene_type:complete
MILCDWQIRDEEIVDPLDETRLNPASLDLTISSARVWNMVDGREQEDTGVVWLRPGWPVLVSTCERVRMPALLAGQLVLKSSMGRRGVSMPAAGWVDPGFEGTLTVQLSACVPVVLRVGDPFIQLVLHRMAGEAEAIYSGRYQGQDGVTLAR